MLQALKSRCLSGPVGIGPARTVAAGARVAWVDAAKGIGIVLVVLGHAVGGLLDSGIEPAVDWFRPLLLTLYLFHMPLFFFLSGLFFCDRLKGGRASIARRALSGLVWPYLLWGTIQTVIADAASQLVNTPGADLGEGLVGMLFAAPPAQFWFLYVLLLSQLTAAMLVPRIGPALFLAAAVALFVVRPPDLPLVFLLTVQMLPYFALGSYVGARGWLADASSISNRQAAGIFGLAAAVFWVIETGLVASVGEARFASMGIGAIASLARSVPALPATVFGIAAVIAIASVMRSPLGDAFTYLGRRSMAIYLLHILALAGTRILLVKVFGITQPEILFLLLPVGIVAPVIAAEVARRLGMARILAL